MANQKEDTYDRSHQHLFHLPARSRAPVCIPYETELNLPSDDEEEEPSSCLAIIIEEQQKSPLPPLTTIRQSSSLDYLVELPSDDDNDDDDDDGKKIKSNNGEIGKQNEKRQLPIFPTTADESQQTNGTSLTTKRGNFFPTSTGGAGVLSSFPAAVRPEQYVSNDVVNRDDHLTVCTSTSANSTTVILVDTAASRPIEKLKRIVKKMQKQQQLGHKDNVPGRKVIVPFVRSGSSRAPSVGFSGVRNDGGRSSLRVDKRPKSVIYDRETGPSEYEIMDSAELLKENIELKHRLEDEEAKYERRLDTYRQAQQHQAALVSRLQAKVLQYKKRCSDLECNIKETLPSVTLTRTPLKSIAASSGSALDAAQQHLREIQTERITDLETALQYLNEERNKCEKLEEINATLREQFEEAQRTNEALTNDLQSLSTDWEQMRGEMLQKEDEWKEEEHFFNDYYTKEHNKIINLWRDVTSMKKAFTDMQSTTKKDLDKLRTEIASTSTDIVGTCNGIFDHTKKVASVEKEQELLQENSTLQMRINLVKTELETLKEQSKFKDAKIQSLTKDIQRLSKKTEDTKQTGEEIYQLREEVEILLTGLREIAQTVVQDADSKDADLIHSIPHIHLSSAMPSTSRLSYPEGGLKIQSTSAFVESTISGIHAALHKYQSQIHELQVKLASQMEQLLLTERQCENQLDSQRVLNQKVNELTEELDSLRAESNILTQEKDSLIKALEMTQLEKQESIKGRNEINNLFDSLSTDYEKMLKNNSKLQKIALSLEDEKNFLQSEVDRILKELETREMNFSLLEERCSQMLEELLNVKEDLNRARLDKELIEQHHSEAQSLLRISEKTKAEIESELQKVLLERTDVNDALSKAENLSQSLELEKRRLQEELKKSEEEKLNYQNQASDLLNDLSLVRKELVNTEQMRIDLENGKMSLLEKYKHLETENSRLESELNTVMNDRAELNNQLVNVQRKKDALNEELIRLRQRIEQVGETNARVNKHLEDLVKECEEKQVMLESNEKEIVHLQELNSLLKADKDTLEATLYDVQNNLEISEMKRSVLEKDQEDLLAKQETLKNDIQRLSKDVDNMGKQAGDTKSKLVQEMKILEAEHKIVMENLKKDNDAAVLRIKEEKEQSCTSIEKRMQAALAECEQEKADELNGMQKKMDSLKQHMDMQCQQHEEALKRAENDKQQSLLLAHQDQNGLLEKLDLLRAELDEEKANFEKSRRESNLKMEQDRNNIITLRDQLTKLAAKIEEIRMKTEEEKTKLNAEMENVKKERDQQMKQCDEIKVELALAEDRLDTVKSQLTETNHRIKEGEKLAESLKKELNDAKRQLNESNLEKEKYLISNKDLREFIKKSEAEKREQARTIEEANQKVLGLEDRTAQLENERARLQNICRDIESKLLQANQKCQMLDQELDKCQNMNQQKQNDEKELLLKLNLEIEDKEKAQHDLHNYKKQLMEMETNLDAYQQELNKLRQHSRGEEERWHVRESELLSKLDNSRSKERKLEDQKHNLEVCLTDTYQQIQDLKAKLSGSESRVRALESQLSHLESSKKESEQKLKTINNTFKRLGLLQQDTGDTPSATFTRLRSSRRWSPGRMKSLPVIQDTSTDGTIVDSSIDFDADAIKRSIRSLAQQLSQAERDKDDLKGELENMKKQLSESGENEKEYENKVTSMVQSLRRIKEEKGNLEAELNQKKSTLLLETQTSRIKSEEVQQLQSKLSALEHQLQNSAEEKLQVEDKLTKLRTYIVQLESEKQKLKDDLSKSDTRSAKLELQKISLEGDLNRIRMVLQDKDSTIQKLQNRLEMQNSSISDLEEKCASLKSTVDQLNVSLEFSGSNENELREEIRNLHKCLTECSGTTQAYEDKIKQLNKSLTAVENERRFLNERLERADQSLSDLQKQCHEKDDQLSKLRIELDSKDMRYVNLQDQLRISKLSMTEHDGKESMHKLQIECCELRGKNQMLEERLRRLENEKRNLERKMTMMRSKSYDRSDVSGIGAAEIGAAPSTFVSAASGLNICLIEHENKELKEKCNRLEAQLMEKENELAKLRVKDFSRISVERSDDLERYRAGQLHAEHLLKAREQSHRQQIEHLKNEIINLKRRLDQETKFRRKYLTDSIGESHNIRQLRDTLADSLRTVSQNPSLDALLLDHETRKLDSSVLLAKSKSPKTSSLSRK